MRNRALQKLPSAAAVARSFSFASALQLAAGRAWARRAISQPPRPSTSPLSPTSDSTNEPSSSRKNPRNRDPNSFQGVNTLRCSSGHRPNKSISILDPKQKRPIPEHLARDCNRSRGVTYVDPDSVNDDDFSSMDPSASIPAEWTASELDLSSMVLTPVSQQLPIRPSRGILLPVTSRRSLWQNILYLFNLEKASLPSLMNYHELHPRFRSTRSFNFLVSLAIRHHSIGTAGWLFSSMQKAGIRPNVETWKLKFRWMVRSGWSDQAWDEFLEALKYGKLPVDPKSRTMLDLCAEFCPRPGPGRRSTEPFARLKLPHHRLRIIWKQFIDALENDLSSIHPRNVYFMILLLLHNQQFAHALSFTTIYFQSLPRELNAHTVDRCLRIIHLQMMFGTSLHGLAKLYWSRKTMKALLRCNPSLRPTSTTLFTLLSPLKRAKRCATVAVKIVREFKRKWGPRMEDSRVRRRLASFALKEGRNDILEDCSRKERTIQRSRRSYLHQASILGGKKTFPYKRLLRFPCRKVLGRTGREVSLWFKLERRARRLKGKKGTSKRLNG